MGVARHDDLTGQRFGRLTAVEYLGNSKWNCRCECGGNATCYTSNLRKGNSTSCGCKRHETNFRHGMSQTKLHQVWRVMRQRCNNPKDPSFHNYGGRGIKVCERWKSFSVFVADMGLRPEGYDIDRIDNDGDYSPENCRWVTRTVNLNNRRNNHNLTWRGETRSLAAWARVLGINERTLTNRIKRGWSVEVAFTASRHERGKRKSTEN